MFHQNGEPLHDQSLNVTFKRLQFNEASGRTATPHGLRSTFKDWACERTNVANEVSEMALAHAIPNALDAAYRRGDLLAKRAKLMQMWADHLDVQTKDRAGNVRRLPASRSA